MKREMFFFKNHTENKAERLVRDLFLFFKKALYEVKASGLQLSFNILIALNLVRNKKSGKNFSSLLTQRYVQFWFFRLPKSQDKNSNILRTKIAFKVKKSIFHHF